MTPSYRRASYDMDRLETIICIFFVDALMMCMAFLMDDAKFGCR